MSWLHQPPVEIRQWVRDLENVLTRLRRRATLFDAEDYGFALKLHAAGVPFHVVERAMAAAAQRWRELHPYRPQFGLHKLRHFERAIWREFRQGSEAADPAAPPEHLTGEYL